MQKLSKKILAEIKKQKIAPRERWIFLIKNYGIWALAIVALLLAAVFVGTSIADLLEAEWELRPHFPGGQLNFFAHTIPFFWFVGIAAAVVLAFFLLRKTKRGYRFGLIALAGSILTASIAGGVSLLSTGLLPKFQEFRMMNFPPHFDESEWQNPDEGFLIGEIIISEGVVLSISSLDGSIWEVDISDAKIPPQFDFVVGDRVRVIGEKNGINSLEAEFIRPEIPEHMREMMRERKMQMHAY
ncbi:MAG: hypothetical protein K9L85_02810 [Candidatus Peribacteraceae bacterium]|nr:hypothetical protein [Candidatus Peribacteraceae bacterium]